jgi:hypothetical protein
MIVIRSKTIAKNKSTARSLKLLETLVEILCFKKILKRMTIEMSRAAMS